MKTLITALLGASMLIPVAAQAQEDNGRSGRRWSEERGDRAPRGERQAQPQAAPQAQPRPPQAQQQVQPQAQAQVQPGQPYRERGGNRGGWRNAPPAQAGMEQQAQFRAAQQQRQQLLQSGVARGFGQQQRDGRPEFARDRRDDRQGAVQDRRDDRQDRRTGSVAPDRFGADRRDDRQDVARDRQRGYEWQDRRTGYAYRDNRVDQRQAWNRGWRNDQRYDWNRYRSGNSNLYRLPRYYAPYGWGGGYRRFSIGITLSSILWAQDYWIDDPYAYRLPEAYGPYRWVRYYGDAMLIDIRDGRVVDVVYDIFD